MCIEKERIQPKKTLDNHLTIHFIFALTKKNHNFFTHIDFTNQHFYNQKYIFMG